MITCEAVAGLRIDCGTIPSDACDLTNRLECVEIEDRQPCRDCRHRGRLVGGRNFARRASRNIQPPSIGVSIDVVPATLSADLAVLSTLYGPESGACQAGNGATNIVRAAVTSRNERRIRVSCRLTL